MTTKALALTEENQRVINSAIQALQRGRNNAHGSFTLNGNGSDTELTVIARNCSVNSHVSLSPTTANAATQLFSGDMYWIAGNGEFTVTHGATPNNDETFTYAIVG